MKAASIVRTFAAATLCVAALAACGDDSDSGAKSGSGSGVGAQGGDAATVAKQLAAKDAAKKTELPKRTLGFIQFTNEAEVAVRMQSAAEAAAKAIGWEFLSCDGQGDPRKQGACGSTLLDRGADVIIANTVAPSVAKRAMTKAKEKGVPWLVLGGVVDPDPLTTANYYPSDEEMATELTGWVVQNAGDGDTELAVVNKFDGLRPYKIRYDTLTGILDGKPSIKIVAEEDVDYANLVEDVRRDVNNVLTANPNVGVIYSVSNDLPPIVSALRGKGKTAENGPMVVGFYGDLVNLDAIRNGTADAVVEWPLEADIWAAIDQAAGNAARGDKIAESLEGQYSLPLSGATVVSKDNLPDKGEYFAPEADFVTYFTEKWGLEYGTGGAGGTEAAPDASAGSAG